MASNNTAMYKIGKLVGQTLKQNLGKKKTAIIKVDTNNGSETADGLTSPTSNPYQAFRTAEQYLISQVHFEDTEQIEVSSSAKIPLFDIIRIDVGSASLVKWIIQKDKDNDYLAGGFIIENSFVTFENQTFKVIDNINQIAGVDFYYPFSIKFSTVIFNNCRFEANSLAFLLLSGSTVILNSCEVVGSNVTVAQCFDVASIVVANNCKLNGNTLKDSNSIWIQTT